MDTAVDSVYTAGSALPPSVFAGMIVYYHPLSKAFKIQREAFSHPVYEYRLTRTVTMNVIEPAAAHVFRRSACSVRPRGTTYASFSRAGGPRA